MKELLTFANEIGKQLEVVNRSRLMRGRYRFQAYFIGSEISEGSFLKGEYGSEVLLMLLYSTMQT